MTDWKVGDLAVCVDASDLWVGYGVGVAGRRFTEGAVYEVAAVLTHHIDNIPVLLMVGQDKTAAARRFRKVQHDKPEACETAFTVLLNRSRRKVGA